MACFFASGYTAPFNKVFSHVSHVRGAAYSKAADPGGGESSIRMAAICLCWKYYYGTRVFFCNGEDPFFKEDGLCVVLQES